MDDHFYCNNKIFSKNLKDLLREKKLTQKDLAKELSKEKGFTISQPTIWRYIHRDHKPDPENINRLARFFGVNEAWLLRGEGPKTRAKPYPITPEHIGIPEEQRSQDSGWDEAGRSDIEGHRIPSANN